MTFEEWWEEVFVVGQFVLTKEDMQRAYENGFNDCRDKWGGLTYKETLEYERDSIRHGD